MNGTTNISKPPSLPTVLVPHEVAEWCYLSEALLWAGFQRFPLASWSLVSTNRREEIWVDEREDANKVEGIYPNLPYDVMVTAGECERAGISLNPMQENILTGDINLPPENEHYLWDKVDVTAPETTQHQRDVKSTIELYRRLTTWWSEFEQVIDKYRAKLFLELHEGRVAAKGWKLPKATVDESLNHRNVMIQEYFNNRNSIDWVGWKPPRPAWQSIPSDFWKSENINWDSCSADGYGASYALILIDTISLIQQFPFSDLQRPAAVTQVGDSYLPPQSGPAPTNKTAAPISGDRQRRPASSRVEAWLNERIKAWPTSRPLPIEEEDWMAAQQELGAVRRSQIRAARKGPTVPPEWRKQGPRG